jgi:hypothetical protein
MTAPKRTSSRETAREHRARMKAQGLVPVTFWVPDVNSPEFIAEARRQSLNVANSKHEASDQAFVDSISVWNEPGGDWLEWDE